MVCATISVEDRDKHISALKKHLSKQEQDFKAEQLRAGSEKKGREGSEKRAATLTDDLRAEKEMCSDLRAQLSSSKESLRQEKDKLSSRKCLALLSLY